MIKQLERRRYYIIKKLTAMKSLTSFIDFRNAAKAKVSNKFLDYFVVLLFKMHMDIIRLYNSPWKKLNSQ